MTITARTRLRELLRLSSDVFDVLDNFGIDPDRHPGERTLEALCRREGVNYWELKSELIASVPEVEADWADSEEEDFDEDGDDGDDDYESGDDGYPEDAYDEGDDFDDEGDDEEEEDEEGDYEPSW